MGIKQPYCVVNGHEVDPETDYPGQRKQLKSRPRPAIRFVFSCRHTVIKGFTHSLPCTHQGRNKVESAKPLKVTALVTLSANR